ncbi:MAG TPA: hypothetical protein PLS48_10325 [Methanotrichaceae archaeon]|nr:hypothetical protein [Methanotrichaceae archaeon]
MIGDNEGDLMQIDESIYPVETAWEGELVHHAGIMKARGKGMPHVSIGKPDWWSGETLGEFWKAPEGDYSYGLARFAFSLRPEGMQEVRKAELMLDFQSDDGGARPVAFDLVPRAKTEEQTGSVTLGIGPDFKLSSVGVTLAKAETTINFKWVFPVIITDGIGESTARWVFASKPAHPLVGSQIVYAVVQLPPGANTARVKLFLSAEIGRFKGFLPQDEECDMSWILG